MENKYQATIDWLFSQVPMFQNLGAGAYKPGLEGINLLSNALRNPHKSLKAIHVGGTNGKGSVSSLLASVLQESGLRVGLYTSPHLIDFRERIRVNGEMITEEAVVDFIEKFRSLNLDYAPSFFELTTVMAFDWFQKCNVDVAVVEVGLGGRLDSTNIITPLASVITNISFDHTAQLGDTLEKIAAEKAGIIKKDIPAIIGYVNMPELNVFVDRAIEVGAPIHFTQNSQWFTSAKNNGDYIEYYDTLWGNVRCPLTGDCQPENAATVFQTLHLLGAFPPEAVQNGFENVLKNTGLMGRWTTLRKNPTVICDTGHNPGGWHHLGLKLCEIADSNSLHIVAGFVNDKDISKIIDMMPRNAKYYWATPSVSRGRDAEDVGEIALSLGIEGKAYRSVEEAFKAARSSAEESDTIFVGGSTFVVADLLRAIKEDDSLIG